MDSRCLLKCTNQLHDRGSIMFIRLYKAVSVVGINKVLVYLFYFIACRFRSVPLLFRTLLNEHELSNVADEASKFEKK